MYSYLSRHKVDLESSTSYEDGCGKLMYDSWGGDSALEWSKRIVEKATKKEQLFSVDNYKGEITAVVFEPDTYIYRFSEGKSYYVFMSKETIKKALMKVSRLKEMGKLQNFINLEHSDYTFNAEDVYTYENWLVGDNSKEDKSYQIFGKEMKPGTWITTIAFKDKKIFEKYVLSNATSGISLEGFFTEIPFNFGDVSPETFIEVRPGESESDYVSRCAGSSVLIGEFPDEKQRLAVCYSKYKNKFEVGENMEITTDGMSPYLTPNEDELETKEVFDFIGDIGGAPAYTTESGADSKSKEMGCEGTHYMEGQGYFPCKTHKEATDLYQSQKIYEMVVEVMKHYKQ
jgi:hypothetical protein